MTVTALDKIPGFRRRFRITPEAGRVCCEVEDDYHCMSLTLHHDGRRVSAVEPDMRRAPWTTCPGAIEQLKRTFCGVEWVDFAGRGEKKANCTHLYDLALLAARHAFDDNPSIYDILVSDPIEGRRRAEIRRDDRTLLGWTELEFRILEPAGPAGMTLFEMQGWIASLPEELQEAARLLRWGNMLANGRIIALENQSDATKMPASCYTFQPQRAAEARRIGEIRDFSDGEHTPLEGYRPFL